ncbi:MAG: DUF1801 domain-containing protein [Rhodococcus sp. (in: high G+C Gram-positive bacteria)]|uniref:iron chaperone n=1 Tax=Rhodococcus sp. TaxID=1831 RepID=UPI003BB13849
MTQTFATVDEYIDSFPDETRPVLEELRQTVRRAAPEAIETISYGMPTLMLNGSYLVYFAGWKHHVSVYPVPAFDGSLETELAPYRAAKGTVRFPLGKPLPNDVVERLLTHLVARRLSKIAPEYAG